MKFYNILLFSVGLLFIPLVSDATSGACSSHKGVDCDRGRQSSGTVYCNDGWTESMVPYDYMEICKSDSEDLIWKQYQYDGKVVQPTIELNNYYAGYPYYCPTHSRKERYSNAKSTYIDGILYEPFYCVCDDGYYNYKSGNITNPEKDRGYVCEKGEPYIDPIIELQWRSNEINDSIKKIKKSDISCKSHYFNSSLKDDRCVCEEGYRWVYDVYRKMVYCIKRNDYEKIIQERVVVNRKVQALRQGLLTQGISDAELNAMNDTVLLHSYNESVQVFRQVLRDQGVSEEKMNALDDVIFFQLYAETLKRTNAKGVVKENAPVPKLKVEVKKVAPIFKKVSKAKNEIKKEEPKIEIKTEVALAAPVIKKKAGVWQKIKGWFLR